MSRIPRILKFGSEAREKLLEGVNILANAVGSTLGPRGQNVAIGQPHGYPNIIHDGVTVAGNIDLLEPFADIGVQLIKEAAQKTNSVAGDGTTTSTILAQAIINESVSHIQAGINPMVLKKGIEDANVEVLKELNNLKKDISKHEEIEQIASISAADPKIGKIVAEAIKKVGKQGSITVEEGKILETNIDYKKGVEIDRGYLSSYFVTDQSRVESIIEEPYILLTDLKLQKNYQIIKFLEKFMKTSKNLVIFAGEVLEEALATLVLNKIRGGWNICAIQAPAYGGRRIDELEDLAVLTGGTVIADESGRNLDDVQIEELGRAEKVVVDRDKSIIISGHGNKKAIEKRIKTLEDQIAVANTDFDEDIKRKRLAMLAGKVAVINVGAITEVEMRDKKERVIDAVNATKAAIEDGIVAGGQIALLHIASKSFWKDYKDLGGSILRQAIKEPFKRLLSNAGLDYAEFWNKVKYPVGIDVIDGEVKDMIEAGIIDPVKVTRSAIENAVSVAVMAMTTNVLIADDPDAKEK